MSEQADNEVSTESEPHEEDQQTEQASDETSQEQQASKAESGGDEDEVTVTFGEEAPTSEDAEKQAAPEWVRELRKAGREKDRQLRERDAELAALKAQLNGNTKPKDEPKPTLADCDYDEEVFEQKLDAWKTQQQAVKAEKEAKEAESRKAQEEWVSTQTAYAEAKKSLKLANFDEAEEAVKSELSEVQQALLLTALDSAENVAKLVAALGGNPAELKRIASIKNPIKFAAAAAKLEEKMKVMPRKAPPAPEKSPKGGTTAVGVQDTVLDRLEAEADRTGDRSKVIAYKRQQKAKAGD